MAKYTHENLGASFVLPDKLTIREQLEWRGRLIEADGTSFVRHWLAVLPLVQEWDYEPFPDLEKIDIDQLTDKKLADVLFWASNAAAGHMVELDAIPKNE